MRFCLHFRSLGSQNWRTEEPLWILDITFASLTYPRWGNLKYVSSQFPQHLYLLSAHAKFRTQVNCPALSYHRADSLFSNFRRQRQLAGVVVHECLLFLNCFEKSQDRMKEFRFVNTAASWVLSFAFLHIAVLLYSAMKCTFVQEEKQPLYPPFPFLCGKKNWYVKYYSKSASALW